MKLLLLGAPGAGKGTQAQIFSAKLGIPGISTGNLLRDSVKTGTEIGKTVKALMDFGNLVPDEIILELLMERMKAPDCARGYILDGMPRTMAQAVALEERGVEIDAVIAIEASDGEIIERMSGRRMCPNCNETYHIVTIPPRVAGVCDACGSPLTTRSDDEPATVRHRLRVYHDETEPLKEFYAKRGLLKSVGEARSIEDTTAAIIELLGL